MRTRLVPAVVAAVAFSGLTVPAHAAPPAAPPAAPAAAPAKATPPRPTSRLQVRFKDGAGAAARDAALAKARGRGHTVRVDRSLGRLNAAVLRVSNPRAVQALLRDDPAVAYVEPESRYLPAAETPQPELAEVGAAAVHAQPSPNLGAGKTIAIIDSPVSATVSDLSGKVSNGGSYGTNYAEEPSDPFRDAACTSVACPHGTAVASVAAGKADGSGMVGVAPGASIRSYDVFRRWTYTDPGTGAQETWSSAASGDVAAAILAVAEDAMTNPGLVAVNMSMESDFDNLLMRDAIAELHYVAPHVTVVAAAGNDGSERANFPAGDPYVLSVGATGQRTDATSCSTSVAPSTPWTVVGFSNRGDVDVVAPGHCVAAWDAVDTNGNGITDTFAGVRKVSGTSFAAPMVAGIAALLADGSPSVTGDAARAAIIASAGGTPSIAYGAGKADAEAALDLAAGSTAYTAVTIERGGQVASKVGRRRVEVLHVDPAGGTPTAPTPAVGPGGYGSLAAASPEPPFAPAQAGLDRDYYTYTVPTADHAGASFALTAGDAAVPVHLLPSYDSFEGLPAATGESGSVKLKHGVNGGYVRSAYVRYGTKLNFSWTFGHASSSLPPGATLNIWEPAVSGGTADAAYEPVYQYDAATVGRTGADYVLPGGASSDDCGYTATGALRDCNRGRYLVGFLTGSSRDNSSSTRTYALKLSYAGPTVTTTAPAVASSASISGPFKVSWAGNSYATKYDVSYAVKTKTASGTWAVTAWTPWLTQTTATSAYFGLDGAPAPVVPGQTYHFRVQTSDTVGNPSLPSVKATAVPYDDRSGSIVYSTGSDAWTKVGVTDRWLKTATKTSAAGARASLSAETSAFTIVGDLCATCGQFKVYVDGVYKKTVDTYRSSGTSVRRVLWSSGSLGSVAPRRVTIIVSGTSGRPKVVLDGIAATR
jgi:subtilisin family serine protease